ncbi:hypothetical protein [Natrinema sp. DC36]|uniref:hypothetical protein n=1 Tax=Natrinema sp. DC36 TaxID=2878680 RepID=UPI001CF067F2|nr:hypothetical protein [Natrinema sp. DC36]
MFNRFTTETIGRIVSNRLALLAVYAVAVELLARIFTAATATGYTALTPGGTVGIRDVVGSIALAPTLTGWQPVGSIVTAYVTDPGFISTLLFPFVIAGYVLAVATVAGIHWRFVRPDA